MHDLDPSGRAGHWRHFAEAGIPCRLWINEPPDAIQAKIDHTGTFYEPAALRMLRALLPPSPRIVDVGANFGNHSVYFARICNAAWLLPLEPNPEILAELRANLAANGCVTADLSQLGVAIGDRRGRLHLRLDAVDAAIRNRGATRLVASPAEATGGGVDVVPLDDIVSGRVDLIKIDVEGMGVAVLHGAAAVIERCAPLIFIEVGVEEMPAFFDWLRGVPYRVVGALSDYPGLTNIVLRDTVASPGAARRAAASGAAAPAEDAEARIAATLATAAAAEAHAARADAALGASLAEIDRLRQVPSNAKAALAARDAAERESQRLRDEIARLRAIEDSFTWRTTAPLRAVFRRMQRRNAGNARR